MWLCIATIGLGKTYLKRRRGGVGKLGWSSALAQDCTEVTSVSFDHRFSNLKANIATKK
jgi:hypothetical protein